MIMLEINNAWQRFFDEILTMKKELADVCDMAVDMDKRIEKLERMVDNG